jgi:hypothetical protein
VNIRLRSLIGALEYTSPVADPADAAMEGDETHA